MAGKSDAYISPAITRTVELLKPEIASHVEAEGGYIDLLGSQDRPRPPLGQWVFHSKLVPPIYERLWRPLVARVLSGKGLSEGEERRRMLQMLDLSPGDRALDVGCGPGNYTRPLADAAENVFAIGIDPSEAMISAAVKRGVGTGIAYVRGNGDQLPFRDDQFAAVCCVGVIHLLEDPMGALDEMVRVLAPGGRVAIAATYGTGKAAHGKDRVGLTVFEPDELTNALSARGLVQVEQHVAKRWQLVSARSSRG